MTSDPFGCLNLFAWPSKINKRPPWESLLLPAERAEHSKQSPFVLTSITISLLSTFSCFFSHDLHFFASPLVFGCSTSLLSCTGNYILFVTWFSPESVTRKLYQIVGAHISWLTWSDDHTSSMRYTDLQFTFLLASCQYNLFSAVPFTRVSYSMWSILWWNNIIFSWSENYLYSNVIYECMYIY